MRRLEQRLKRSRAVPGGTEYALEFGLAGSDRIPALLTLPAGSARAPAALLLHGYSSRKEMMSEHVGRGLLAHGVAGLAIDLPLHGDRKNPVQTQAMGDPLQLVRRWREALAECALGLGYLGARAEIDRERLAIVGYSLGSYLAVASAAKERTVKAVVLAAGGDLPSGTPVSMLARSVADPLKAVRQIAGRPLLMVHGRRDRTVTPDQARRLYEAAGNPKELRWYDAGHILPAGVIDGVGAWLADRLKPADRSGTG
ncbi:MAG TPA: alpha/beta fold hydrolase [Gemmatimonadaceae bacterium]|nr:alpha/beta fold hydrolase [Gemmatimonadaceae bacterium]